MIININTSRIIGLLEYKQSKLASQLNNLVGAATLIAANRARLAPKDTGDLRSSIQSTITPGITPTGTVTTGVEYAYWVETGEGRGPAQPYMAPAFLLAQQHVRSILPKLEN